MKSLLKRAKSRFLIQGINESNYKFDDNSNIDNLIRFIFALKNCSTVADPVFDMKIVATNKIHYSDEMIQHRDPVRVCH